MAAGAKIWLQDIQNSLQSSFSHFCRDLNLSQIHGLLEPLYLGFFFLAAKFYFTEPWLSQSVFFIKFFYSGLLSRLF